MTPPEKLAAPVVYDRPPAELGELRAHLLLFARGASVPPAADTAHAPWAPLLAISAQIGDTIQTEARAALERITGTPLAPASNLALLADIAALFAIEENVRIPTTQLIERLIADPELPWASLRRGARLGARDLAERLGHFGIRPTTFRLPDGAIVRGYYGAHLKDAVSRYLPFRRAN
jgi:hypothetical protein